MKSPLVGTVGPERRRSVAPFMMHEEEHAGKTSKVGSVKTELAELHVHLGSSVSPEVMWEIAHAQGIKLHTKSYWDFVEMITVDPQKGKAYDDYLKLFHITELIQSSPMAVERSVYHTVGGAYRDNNITLLELRFNPMKRNKGGEQDLDHIIMAANRGLERAVLEYQIKGGIIICLDRTFTYKQNEILVNKALKYAGRGIVGIDIAGPRNKNFRYSDYSGLYEKARSGGLGLTVHTGEEQDYHSVVDVINSLNPDRLGHGIRATENEDVIKMIGDRGITLEICPTSNIELKIVEGSDQMRDIFEVLRKHRIRFTINTDGPEMLMTSLRNEFAFLLRNGILTEAEAMDANAHAFEASFLRRF